MLLPGRVASVARKRSDAKTDQVCFQVLFLKVPGKHESAEFKAVCGPGDGGAPVVTIMLPHED